MKYLIKYVYLNCVTNSCHSKIKCQLKNNVSKQVLTRGWSDNGTEKMLVVEAEISEFEKSRAQP